MDESVSDKTFEKDGLYIDLYNHKLPVLDSIVVTPGNQRLYIDMSRVDKTKPQVLAAASREYDEKVEDNRYSYVAKSPINTTNASRVLLPASPKSVMVAGVEVYDTAMWDEVSNTYFLEFENSPDGVEVVFEW